VRCVYAEFRQAPTLHGEGYSISGSTVEQCELSAIFVLNGSCRAYCKEHASFFSDERITVEEYERLQADKHVREMLEWIKP
jgi:hypothetical protein